MARATAPMFSGLRVRTRTTWRRVRSRGTGKQTFYDGVFAHTVPKLRSDGQGQGIRPWELAERETSSLACARDFGARLKRHAVRLNLKWSQANLLDFWV